MTHADFALRNFLINRKLLAVRYGAVSVYTTSALSALYPPCHQSGRRRVPAALITGRQRRQSDVVYTETPARAVQSVADFFRSTFCRRNSACGTLRCVTEFSRKDFVKREKRCVTFLWKSRLSLRPWRCATYRQHSFEEPINRPAPSTDCCANDGFIVGAARSIDSAYPPMAHYTGTGMQCHAARVR